MQVKYTGNYRDEPSVRLNGVSFEKGKPTEVTREWFAACKNPNVKEVKAKASGHPS